MAPFDDATAIVALESASNGLVFGLTDAARFFVFDSSTRKIVHQSDWSSWGKPSVTGRKLLRTENGLLLALLPRVVLQIRTDDFSARKIADLPVAASAGGALKNNRLYFADNEQLCSIQITP